MTAEMTLDPEIVAMCEEIPMIQTTALLMGQHFADALAAFVAALRGRRVHTGYMPRPQRDSVAHGLYDLGIRKPPARETAADRARVEAQKWGLAS